MGNGEVMLKSIVQYKIANSKDLSSHINVKCQYE